MSKCHRSACSTETLLMPAALDVKPQFRPCETHPFIWLQSKTASQVQSKRVLIPAWEAERPARSAGVRAEDARGPRRLHLDGGGERWW